jgi:hypothetical protein
MQLEVVGVTQPQKHGPYQSSGSRRNCVIEVRKGEPAADVAKKLAGPSCADRATCRRG